MPCLAGLCIILASGAFAQGIGPSPDAALLRATTPACQVMAGEPDKAFQMDSRAGTTQTERPVMAGFERDLWMVCHGAGGNQLQGFCARLGAELAQTSGRRVLSEGVIPVGAEVVEVTITPANAVRAAAVLRVGRQGAGGLTVSAQQDLSITVTDGTLGADSATTLIYPLMKMLGGI